MKGEVEQYDYKVQYTDKIQFFSQENYLVYCSSIYEDNEFSIIKEGKYMGKIQFDSDIIQVDKLEDDVISFASMWSVYIVKFEYIKNSNNNSI